MHPRSREHYLAVVAQLVVAELLHEYRRFVDLCSRLLLRPVWAIILKSAERIRLVTRPPPAEPKSFLTKLKGIPDGASRMEPSSASVFAFVYELVANPFRHG